MIVNNNVAAYQRRDPSSDEDERDADQEQDPENREEFDSALPIQHAVQYRYFETFLDLWL